MSELLDVADQLVPYVASAGVGVITAAQADFAQHVLDRGKRLVRALLHRGEGDVPPEEREQDAALRGLPRPALEELAVAVDAWLSAGDLSPGALRRCVEDVAQARGGEYNSGTAHGANPVGIGKVVGGLTINNRPPEGA
ncbi:hypothetical protein AB0N81_24060 [Streptomyces sp. NPDC093510]|uniref:hypothetical protein n=1 Tax=Streptomyces sp. NPDC093510 TaxID=3155199 RepID=UPI0034127F45